MKAKHIFVLGGTGFIGHHLARRLTKEGNTVYVLDIKGVGQLTDNLDYYSTSIKIDLARQKETLEDWIDSVRPDEIYQLAADMGGAGYIFTGNNDYNIMSESVAINLNLINTLIKIPGYKPKVFYSSSACIYPSHNQTDPSSPNCKEESAYPANPDSEYGWEKLFSERLYLSAKRNFGMDVRIARFHNIFGPEGTWEGGKEKAPAATCRKVIESTSGIVDVWGPGTQTRSFLYIDECVEGVLKLMESDFTGPVNIGSEEMISMNDLTEMVAEIAGKDIEIRNIPGPVGVMGRNSDNRLLKDKLGWEPKQSLISGMRKTFHWIYHQVEKKKS